MKVHCCNNKETALISVNLIDDEEKNILNISSRINHQSFVKFIEYSPVDFNGREKTVIINEFVANGSLRKVIFQVSKDKKIQG